MNKFFSDFKAFISKGNVIDLAVAVVIGAAFKPVISSLVDNVLMPPIGLALGGVDFSDLKIIIQKANLLEGTAEVAIGYGVFIQSIIDFVIIGFCVFLVVQAYNKMQTLTAKQEAAIEETTPVEPSTEEKLLTEIRDLLQDKALATAAKN